MNASKSVKSLTSIRLIGFTAGRLAPTVFGHALKTIAILVATLLVQTTSARATDVVGDNLDISYNATISGTLTVGTNIYAASSLGIGTTAPSPGEYWNGSHTLQLGDRMVLMNIINSQLHLGENAYYDGTWKYVQNGTAKAVRMTDDDGSANIRFYIASSGDQNDTIPDWDTAAIKMAINENGKVGIGTKAPTEKLDVVGTVKAEHIKGGGNAPSIGAGSGAGSSPTINITGKDSHFRITITTGTSPSANATVTTVTFAAPYEAGDMVHAVFSPANAAAAGVSASTYQNTTTQSMSIKSSLAASTQYIWDVFTASTD
jgi:hypothetical protein